MNAITKFDEYLPTIIDNTEAVEELMLQFPQADCPVRHIFGPGVYIRELTMFADTYAIGHHQNFEHMNVMIKGKVRMYNPDGTTTVLTAPQTFVGKPGRKVGYVIEDTVWQNIYADTEQDVDKLEAKYLTKSEFNLEVQSEVQKLLGNVRQEDRDDYQLLLKQIGMTEEEVRVQVDNTTDRTELPFGNYKFQTGDSLIEGKGVFAVGNINKLELIGPARINGLRTILGYQVNHSKYPNAFMVAEGNDIMLVALNNIKGKQGTFLGEEITVDYRQALVTNLQIGQKEQ